MEIIYELLKQILISSLRLLFNCNSHTENNEPSSGTVTLCVSAFAFLKPVAISDSLTLLHFLKLRITSWNVFVAI